MSRTDRDALTIATGRGALQARREDGEVWVNMGAPMTAWDEIPLAEPVDTDHLPLPGDPAATGMGNPHCTFFVTDAEGADLAAHGTLRDAPALPPADQRAGCASHRPRHPARPRVGARRRADARQWLVLVRRGDAPRTGAA